MTARNDGPAGAGGPGDELLDVIVVGGSQAGLAMAWHLAREGLRFVVLEAAPEIGHTWRSRWDSLTLFTPTQYDALPGMPFPGPPDTYPTKDPVADYLTAYAAAFDLPVRLNARVTRLRRTDGGLRDPHATVSVFRARQVVVATGPFQVPFIPPAAQRLDGVGDPAAQRRIPQPAGPAGRAGAGRRRRQLRVPDRRRARRQQAARSTCRSPPSSPVLPQRLGG